MDSTSRSRIIKDVIENCSSLTVAELEALEDWQLSAIDATDCNWCFEPETLEWCDSVKAAVSSALYATYEQVTSPYATPDNY